MHTLDDPLLNIRWKGTYWQVLADPTLLDATDLRAPLEALLCFLSTTLTAL